MSALRIRTLSQQMTAGVAPYTSRRSPATPVALVAPKTPPRDAPGVAVAPRPAAGDALRLARRRFLAPARLDMSALADELGVNRVTLYRWVGSRDRLIVEVVWSLASITLRRVDADVGARGAERIVQVVTRFLDAVIGNPGMQRWLAEEGEHAMRLLTLHDTDFQPRLIGAVEDLLDQEARGGRLDLPIDRHDLAYVIVRLIESYTYLDLITGEQPDASRAEPILRMLLRAPVRAPR
jgi:AcrR family transcriptional regulator